MIRLIHWLMPVKTPDGWTIALTQEDSEGIRPIIGLLNFTTREEVPDIAQFLYKYFMKLDSEWDSVVGDKPEPQTDIPDAFLRGWNDV